MEHIYLTYLEIGTGIYKSQVIDVVAKLNELGAEKGYKIRLVALAPLRTYSKNKEWLKENAPDAIVLPAVPRIKNWKLNRMVLNFLFLMKGRPKTILARNILAAHIAKGVKGAQVIFDGRGAIWKEAEEYNIFDQALSNEEVKRMETEAVHQSAFRLAVSNQLVAYWKKYLGYTQNNHVVVPCTLSTHHLDEAGGVTRKDLGWSDDSVVLVFSGSLAGWQSLDDLYNPLEALLEKQHEACLMFLSKENELTQRLEQKFSGRVKRFWLDHKQVFSYLSLADYGLLLRSPSITNKVASPVKFAEYLSAGLQVLISSDIGDFSESTQKEKLGHVLKSFDDLRALNLTALNSSDRERSRAFAAKYFNKSSEDVEARFKQIVQFSLDSK
ncbi:hypothetical protein KFE98_00780 [bacterium SCSIO 12741]|nr:hypothetical protein KFE98_00780 [bacterium SCSIO 12741]